ncbi:unnamed protein product [Caenorhabditis angaria]|uniref:Transmembrane protein 242 n=1 Tax=Caenorhabditis angaria TaxID=860376 RepID=A0A9P1MTK8_9PELO|nr:unnamed protein product [Caenorhabditis angaria]
MSEVQHQINSRQTSSSSFSGNALVALDRIDTSNTAGFVKSVIGGTSLVTFLLGLRSAWKHSRQPEAADLAKAQLFSGAAFAGKALAVATVLTVSGFTLIIVGVSAVLQNLSKVLKQKRVLKKKKTKLNNNKINTKRRKCYR